MRHSLRIATVGDNCIDRYLPPLNYALAGGNAVNVAVQLAMLGCEAAYFGAIGDDRDGRFLQDALKQTGVGLGGLIVNSSRPTAYTDIATEGGGERRFVYEEFGACADYRVPEFTLAQLATYDHVHIGWLNDGGAVKRQLHGLGVSVSQDLSVNNTLENLDPEGLTIAFASAEVADAEATGRALLARRAKLAVITLGAAGSLAMDGLSTVRAPAVPVEPVDTTGAGDSFIAGFLWSHLRGESLELAMSCGASQARATCLHLGGFPQTPLSIG